MRFLFKLFLWLIVLSPIGLAAVAWFALENQPLLASAQTLSHADMAHAQRVIRENDPRRFPAGTEHRVRISERDLNLAVNYLLQQVGGSVQVKMHQDFAQLLGSVRIPKLPLKRYLNIALSVANSGDEFQVLDLRIGRIPLPRFIARLVIHELLPRFFRTEQGVLVKNIIKEINLSAGQVIITYLWQPDLIERVRDTLISPDERQAMATYYNELANLQAAGKARRGSLLGALQPLFQLARQRSESGSDPVSENRSLLLVLGAWASGRGMGKLLPAEERSGHISGFPLTLDRRNDFGQHFLVSAAISSSSDSSLSNAIGLFKEKRDSQGGSGFSFADLAADRAGTRFGEVATLSAASARRVQQLLAAGIKESAIIPNARDLPERLSAAEFKRRFGMIGSPTYNKLANEIERRIAACSLYNEA